MKRFYAETGRCLVVGIVFLMLLSLAGHARAAENKGGMTVEKKCPKCVQVSEDGKFFAQYRTNYKGAPIVWPICSADGLLMTRAYPMIEDEDVDGQKDAELLNIMRNAKAGSVAEAHDHPHHRSLWFTHGNVNGCDFWALDKQADIVHDEFSKLEAKGNTAIVQTKNRWVDTKNNITFCKDLRTFVFGTLKVDGRKVRYIDLYITVTACQDEVCFNDTKEGTFGLRVPGTMDANMMKRNKRVGIKSELWGGHIINSKGDKDDDAWSKKANWVDYYGPVPARCDQAGLDAFAKAGSPEALKLATGGITIMQHPTSYQYPTWWHVRTYGLFTANPFGQKDFEKDNKAADGTLRLKKGESFSCGYRVLFHDGTLTPKVIDGLYKDFAAAKCPVKK